MRLPSIAPDHRLIGQCAARYLFDMGHQAVMNVMCLRRYTMELRLVGIKEAWRARNLRFTGSRDLISVANFSARETEEQVGAWLDALQGRPMPTAFWWAAILWPPVPSARCKTRPAGAAGCLGDEYRRFNLAAIRTCR